jgi:hypothetical protein
MEGRVMGQPDADAAETEDVYMLTALGLLQHCLGDQAGQKAFDALELYAVRCARGLQGAPALVFNVNGGRFIVVSPPPGASR